MDTQLLILKFCDYGTYFKGYSPNTLNRYKQAIKFFASTSNVPTVHHITEETLRQFFFTGRVERKWTVGNFMGYYKSLKAFLNWCVKEGYFMSNPILTIEKPKLEKKLPAKLTKQEAQKILEYAFNNPRHNRFIRYRDHAMFATFIFAGLRRAELINLRYSDVDLENLSLFIRQGKGAKDRVIPICYTLANSLKRYLEERKLLNKFTPHFFVSMNYDKGVTINSLKKIVANMVKLTGIKFSLHKLRHTFATLMLEGGCDIYSIAKMMGHSDIKTTTIYLYATVEHLKMQINKHPLN